MVFFIISGVLLIINPLAILSFILTKSRKDISGDWNKIQKQLFWRMEIKRATLSCRKSSPKTKWHSFNLFINVTKIIQIARTLSLEFFTFLGWCRIFLMDAARTLNLPCREAEWKFPQLFKMLPMVPRALRFFQS